MRWRLVEKLSLQEKLGIEITWLDVNFSSEFDYVSENDKLLGILDIECLSIETIGLLNDVRLNQAMERDFGITRAVLLLINYVRVFGVVVVGIRVKYLIILLIEYLELHEIETLLDEINISEMLQMQNELGNCSQ